MKSKIICTKLGILQTLKVLPKNRPCTILRHVLPSMKKHRRLLTMTRYRTLSSSIFLLKF